MLVWGLKSHCKIFMLWLHMATGAAVYAYVYLHHLTLQENHKKHEHSYVNITHVISFNVFLKYIYTTHGTFPLQNDLVNTRSGNFSGTFSLTWLSRWLCLHCEVRTPGSTNFNSHVIMQQLQLRYHPRKLPKTKIMTENKRKEVNRRGD